MSRNKDYKVISFSPAGRRIPLVTSMVHFGHGFFENDCPFRCCRWGILVLIHFAEVYDPTNTVISQVKVHRVFFINYADALWPPYGTLNARSGQILLAITGSQWSLVRSCRVTHTLIHVFVWPDMWVFFFDLCPRFVLPWSKAASEWA